MYQATSAVVTKYHLGKLSIARRLVYMLTFNVLLIASAYIQIPLPFSPVPITAQTMAALACGLFLGPVAGAATVLAYLAEGAMGLPVFAGGSAGLVKLFGPTGGYLFGFVAAAFVVGLLSARMNAVGYGKLLGILTIGTALIFVPGLIVLALFVPNNTLLSMGLYPFIPGAVFKIVATATTLSAYKRIRKSI